MTLQEKKHHTKLDNVNLAPYENPRPYICKTCETINQAHPVTSFCFICGDDNWFLEEDSTE